MAAGYMLRRPWVSVLTVTLGLIAPLLASSPASAQGADGETGSLVVLGIRSVEGDDDFTRSLSGVLRQAATTSERWHVSGQESTLAQMSLMQGCDEVNAECLGQIGQALSADELIYGEVRRTAAGEEYDFSLNLHLFNVRAGQIVRSVTDTIPHSQQDVDNLQPLVSGYVAQLQGAPRVGAVQITVNVPNAEVFIDGESVGRTDAHGALVASEIAAGNRSVRITAEGHQGFRSTISIEAYGQSTFEAELVPNPVGGGGGVPVDAIFGGSLLAIGAAASVLWIYSMARIDAINSNPIWANAQQITARETDICVHNQPAGGSPTNAELANLCSEGGALEILQFVFLGAGVASVVGGGYLLLDALMNDDAPSDRALMLVPTLSPEELRLDLYGTF